MLSKFFSKEKMLALAIFQLAAIASFAQKNFTVSSPDKKISVICYLTKDGMVNYSINYLKEKVLDNSKLGLIREDEDFSKGLQFTSTSNDKLVKDSYHILTAKKSNITYTATQKVISLKTVNGKKMNIVFQVSNDGVAFRYQFPEQSKDVKKIVSEATTFHFNEGTKAWLQPKAESLSGWEKANPSYEEHYLMDIPTGTPSPFKNGWVYPAMFHYKNVWLLLTEANLGRTYCGTALQQESPNNEYAINFPQAGETMVDSIVNPQSTLPWNTPWRIIALGNLKTIAESTLGTDLALPAKKMDASFIKPGKASWSWILLKDDSTIYNVQKRYIDYAAAMHWQYCLVDEGWDKQIGWDKMQELSNYAAAKKVGLLVWYNSAGNWNTVNATPRNELLTHLGREEQFSRLEKIGIKGIKIDFFGGDGQWMMNYYRNILDDAAKHHLLVNFHGCSLPRGLQRTYPNLMTAEAVYGYEMITMRQDAADLAPSHMVMAAFARNAFDPMDFTPLSLYKIPNINRTTTPSFELALSVLFISGIQHYVESPDGMTHVSTDTKSFLKSVPSVWDDVKFIDGFPGKYYVVARRAGAKWYITGINATGSALKLNMDLSFLGTKTTGTVYTENEAKEFPIESAKLNLKNPKSTAITLQDNAGFVMVF